MGKASSAHNTTIAALEKAGLTPNDVSLVYLPPADALAAFQRGLIDVWTIWDPFFAGQKRHSGPAFSLAPARSTPQVPSISATRTSRANTPTSWRCSTVSSPRPPAGPMRTGRSGEGAARGHGRRTRCPHGRHRSRAIHSDACYGPVATNQQIIADRFARLGLIPKQIKVRDIVWTWKPAA